MPVAPSGSAGAPDRRPTALVVACAVLALEVVLLGVGAVVAGAGLVGGVAVEPGAGVFLAAFALVVAGVLALCTRGLWNGQRWARGPAITWQLLQATVAIPLLRDGQVAVGLGLLVPVVTVVVSLLLPAAVAATTGRAGGDAVS